MKLELYCTCGAAYRATSIDARGALFVRQMFQDNHTGLSHAETDAAGARNGRRRADRQDALEYAQDNRG